jgi:hypothetical protein
LQSGFHELWDPARQELCECSRPRSQRRPSGTYVYQH